MKPKTQHKSIIIIIDYFGQWPDWFSLFLESCKRNPTINWLFHTDCVFEHYKIENVTFKYTSKEEYIAHVNKKLNTTITWSDSYKLCDLKPMYGAIHEQEIRGYDFYGYGDIDVIYGNIRHFYTPDVLENNVISTHEWCISGHLALFKNTKWMRNAFKRYKGWKNLVENTECQRFDEDLFNTVFKYPKMHSAFFLLYDILHPLSIKYRQKLYFVEQFTTPLTPSPWRIGSYYHPEKWFWKNGMLTNINDRHRQCIYLHFMNFVSGRWMDSIYKKDLVWKELNEYVFVSEEQMKNKGLLIDRSGFHILENEHLHVLESEYTK
ncbi:MAG: DUF6625 family protein [Flavobacterium sp.]